MMTTGVVLAGAVLAAVTGAIPAFQEGVRQTTCEGLGVKSYDTTCIYEGAPDMVEDVSFQTGNANARLKVRPKPSQELKGNFFGVDSTRIPCLTETMEFPSEAVHLLDGDVESVWLSECLPRADVQPLVVRVDLARAHKIAKIVLRKRPLHGGPRNLPANRKPLKGAVESGRALPVEMTVSVATDGYAWRDVFSGPTDDDETKESFEISFPACEAKQVRLTIAKTRLVEFFLYGASFAELEILDEKGRNRALVSEGACVTATGTRHQELPYLPYFRDLWATMWDSGVKWVRIGYHDDAINWHHVERSKGVYTVDPLADASITALKDHGINVIFNLGFGNRLYSGPEKRRFTCLQEWNWDMPYPPTTPEALDAWERYVTFICRHFADRVHTFEIWNEWNNSSYWGRSEANDEHYAEILRRTIPILRREAPRCKVKIGAVSCYPEGLGRKSVEELKASAGGAGYRYRRIFRAWETFGAQVDVLGIHTTYNTAPGRHGGHTAELRAFQDWIAAQGWGRRDVHICEWSVSGGAPGVAPEDDSLIWCGAYAHTEVGKAKEVLRRMVRYGGLGMTSCFCEMHNANFSMTELSLFKRTIVQDPIVALQPTMAYYALRNACTMWDGLKPAAFAAEIEGAGKRQVESFAWADGTRRAVSVWYEDAQEIDAHRGVPVTLTLPFAAKGELWVCDPLNGVRQKLNIAVKDGRTTVAGFALDDSPLLVVGEVQADGAKAGPRGPAWNEGAPRINGPRVFGATPGRNFRYPFPACGAREGLVWSAEGKLPAGVSVNPQLGVLVGRTKEVGEWPFVVKAKNRFGEAEKPFTLVIGPNARALTPPMGWSSWNACSSQVDQRHVEENARALVEKGLAAHGYSFVNLDSCWQGRRSKQNGALQPDPEYFPDMAGLVKAIHALGLKAGIYSTPMVQAWGGTNIRQLLGGSAYPLDPDYFHPYFGGCGKRGYEREDAGQFASWGFDWLKYDWSLTDLEHTRRMREALDRTGRDIVLQVCTHAQFTNTAYASYAQVVRCGGDTKDEWENLRQTMRYSGQRLPFVRPGYWLDLDMLAVGPMAQWHKGTLPYAGEPLPDSLANRLTEDEATTHFAWWAILPTPLLVSCDLPHIDDFTLALITNDELIEINQDYPAKPAVQRAFGGERYLWTRTLSDGRTVLGFFNLGDESWDIRHPLDGKRSVRDAVARRDLGTLDVLEATLAPHACRVFVLKPALPCT